jgi:putative PIN family toxin of toxin-antitoxin system
MRIVLDTNVLISGIFWKGIPYKILKLWVNGQIEIVATNKIINEYFEVLKRIDKSGEIAKKWRELILKNVIIVKDKGNIRISRDPDDDIFISCALSANANYIVSGDNDLLTLKEIEGIKIISPAVFIHHMKYYFLPMLT